MCGWCPCLWSFGLGGWWWRKEAQTGEKVLALKRVVLAKGHVIYNKRTVVTEQHCVYERGCRSGAESSFCFFSCPPLVRQRVGRWDCPPGGCGLGDACGTFARLPCLALLGWWHL